MTHKTFRDDGSIVPEPTLIFKVGTMPFGPVYDLDDAVIGEVVYATEVCGVWALHREETPDAMRLRITAREPGRFIKADRA